MPKLYKYSKFSCILWQSYLRRPILKFIKTKELCANQRKVALTIPWLEGITNTWRKNPGDFEKDPSHLPPKIGLVTPLIMSLVHLARRQRIDRAVNESTATY